MADLVAADLTYTIQNSDKEDKYLTTVATITTAAGEYPTGGLPLSGAQLGMPNAILDLEILEGDASSTDLYKFDQSAETIKVFQENAGTYAEHANAAYTSPTQLVVKARGY